MAKMKTLTINGQTFTVDDQDAVQAVNADDTMPEAGTVPTADGKGGATWEKPASGLPENGATGQFLGNTDGVAEWQSIPNDVVYVTVTKTDDTYSADKTVDELLEAYNAGKTLVCIYSNSNNTLHNAYELSSVRPETSEITFKRLFPLSSMRSYAQYLVITADGVTEKNVYLLPDGATAGQVLTYSGSTLKWVDVPTELPTGGTAGQVLTVLEDDSVGWADPVATSAEGVLFG